MRSVLPLTSRGAQSRYIKGMKEFGGGGETHGGLLLQGELAKKRPSSNRIIPSHLADHSGTNYTTKTCVH